MLWAFKKNRPHLVALDDTEEYRNEERNKRKDRQINSPIHFLETNYLCKKPLIRPLFLASDASVRLDNFK